VEALASDELIVAHPLRDGRGQACQFTTRHTLALALALALATLAARSARPSGVSDCQHLEHKAPRTPVWSLPQAWQLTRTAAANRPA